MRTSSSSAQGEYSSTSRYGQPTSYDSVRMEPSVSMTDDLEPSDEWKERLKKKIADELAAMEADATRQLEDDIRSVPHQRDTIMREHQKALQNIRVLAEDKFRTQLEHERQERKWAAAIPMEDSVIPDTVRAEQEALFARIKQESGGDPSQNSRPVQPPGSAGISPPIRSNSRAQQPLPVLPDRPPLPPNMPPPPTSSPSKPEVWVPKSSASSASSSRPPQSQRKDPPPSIRDWQDRGMHPPGGFPRSNDEHDAPGLSKSPPPPSARSSPWSAEGLGPPGGFGGGGTSPRPIDRPATTSPFINHPAYQPHQPLPPSMASSPPGTSPSPQLWQPSISPEEDTPPYASALNFGPGARGPGSATSTSSSTSKPFSPIGRRTSSGSMRSIASTNSARSIASATSMTSIRSSISSKGRMTVDDVIPERTETDSDAGYDEDDDYEYGQSRGMEPAGNNEEMMHNMIAESKKRMQQEQQRQKGVEMGWHRPVGGDGEVDDPSSRPTRAKALSSIPVLPVGPSSSSESKKSGKRKSKSKPLSASATAPPSSMYEAGYLHSGKDWDTSRDWEREEPGQSKTMRNALNSSTTRPPSSATRPITIQPTLIADEFESSYAHSQSPHPPLSSSASSSKRSKSISRKASSNFTEPAIYGPDDVPPARSGRRWSNEQNSQMYGAGNGFEGSSTGFEYAGHRRNTSGPSVLPTPPSSASNTRANSLRYPPPNRNMPSMTNPIYTQEPEGYDEAPAGVMDGYEGHRLSRDAGEMEDEWQPENPKRRLSASASSAARRGGSIRRTPGRPMPQPLSFDHGDDESSNLSYRERTAPIYPNEGSQSAYPTYPQTWNPPRSENRPTGGGDPSPQKAPRPPHSAEPYGYASVSKRKQQSLREQEERQEPVRPQRTTSMRSNGKSASAGLPPDWYPPHRPGEPAPSRRPSQHAWGPPPPGPPHRRPPGDSDGDQDDEDQEEESSGDPEEDYRRRSGYQDHDVGESEGVQYPHSHSGMGSNDRGFTGHGAMGPAGIRGRHQHRYRQPSQRDRRVRIKGGDELEQPESEEQSQEEEEGGSEEDSDAEEESRAGGLGHRRNAGDESDFFPPIRSIGRSAPFPPGQYAAPGLVSRAPSGGPGYPRRGDGRDAIPPPQYREPERKHKKKQKKRWLDEERERAERELADRQEAERTEAERMEKVEAERVERERVEMERKEREHAEGERREREKQEKEERERRQREEQEKRERQEREKREYMVKREREERELKEKEERERREKEERERAWEQERQEKREDDRRRELERERRREREREKERREREAKDRAQRDKEEEIEKRLEDLKTYAAEAEEKMRHAQDLVEKNKLADERAEEYQRKKEEAAQLAQIASKKWKEAEARYNDACLLVQSAKQRAAEAKKKELEIMDKEKELKAREEQLRRLEEELKRKEEDRMFEERRRIVEEERRRLEEEANEDLQEPDQTQEQEKVRLQEIVMEQAKQLEELKRERDEEKAKNIGDESYGLAEIFNLEDAAEEPATIALEEERAGVKKPKVKKGKSKGKGKKAREEEENRDALEERKELERKEREKERLACEEKEREEAEERQRLEEEQRVAEEQAERERQAHESKLPEERERRKRRKDKRKSKEQQAQGQTRESQLHPTPDELEEWEQQTLAAEERRKQDEQEARRLEQERMDKEKQEEQARRERERERIVHKMEVEAKRRAREEMEAEEKFRREQETKRREEEERMEKRRLEEEERRREDESQGAQQAGYRKLEEEIRRKRQDSGGGIDSAWTSFNAGSSSFSGSSRSPPPARNFTTPFPGDRPTPAWASWGTTPTPTTPGSAWSTNMAGSTSNAGFPPRPSTTMPSKPRSGSMGSGVPDHQEWQRKQAEFSRQQEEKFRKEQERAQRAAWTSREAGRIPTREEFVRLFEDNERAWTSLSSATALRWSDLPWPMVKRPSNPEDITTTAIEGYVLSQYYPDKSKTDKDRVKEYIKRWHPDRFETKLLNKVVEEERERVKEGAGSVARSLNDILAKMNDS